MELADPGPETSGGQDRSVPDVSQRLEAVERRLRDVAVRLDHLEGSVTEVIAAENRALVQEMRHTMSELARLIVKDLGRLGKIMEKDRDAILDALGPAPADPELPAPADPEPVGSDSGSAIDTEPDMDTGPDIDTEPDAVTEADSDTDSGSDQPGPRRRRGPFRAKRS